MVIVAVAVTFGVVYRDTGSQLRAAIERDTQGDAAQLVHAVIGARSHSPAQVLANARHYAASQPFDGVAATLLFVIVPGVGTASNHPVTVTARAGISTDKSATAGRLQVFEQRLMVGGHAVYAGAAESLKPIDRAQASVARAFALAAVIALMLAVIAAYLIGARISAPLQRIAAFAAQVDGGDLDRRLESVPRASRELRVFGDAFNHMLDRLARAFTRQREFVADASHELRTPLTVMRGQLELLAADENVSADEVGRIERLLQSEVGRVTRIVDDLLVLAQSERRDFLNPAEIELASFARELWDGLSLIADRRFDVVAPEPIPITADPDRLAQALRNLGLNAIRHTTDRDGLVRLTLSRPGPKMVRIAVEDDGPGIAPELREQVFARFYRTDPARTRAAGGAGLGLSIVRAIVAAHGGQVRVLESDAGGARFEIDLPAAR